MGCGASKQHAQVEQPVQNKTIQHNASDKHQHESEKPKEEKAVNATPSIQIPQIVEEGITEDHLLPTPKRKAKALPPLQHAPSTPSITLDLPKPVDAIRSPRKTISFDINEITAQFITKDKRDLGFLERKDVVEVFETILKEREIVICACGEAEQNGKGLVPYKRLPSKIETLIKNINKNKHYVSKTGTYLRFITRRDVESILTKNVLEAHWLKPGLQTIINMKKFLQSSDLGLTSKEVTAILALTPGEERSIPLSENFISLVYEVMCVMESFHIHQASRSPQEWSEFVEGILDKVKRGSSDTLVGSALHEALCSADLGLLQMYIVARILPRLHDENNKITKEMVQMQLPALLESIFDSQHSQTLYTKFLARSSELENTQVNGLDEQTFAQTLTDALLNIGGNKSRLSIDKIQQAMEHALGLNSVEITAACSLIGELSVDDNNSNNNNEYEVDFYPLIPMFWQILYWGKRYQILESS